uniref:Acyl_transf_3 domain-containing protein n=1 Tax=Steinernema glaseri TaxID=37863 RepID=A0A1I7YP79_9BILA
MLLPLDRTCAQKHRSSASRSSRAGAKKFRQHSLINVRQACSVVVLVGHIRNLWGDSCNGHLEAYASCFLMALNVSISGAMELQSGELEAYHCLVCGFLSRLWLSVSSMAFCLVFLLAGNIDGSTDQWWIDTGFNNPQANSPLYPPVTLQRTAYMSAACIWKTLTALVLVSNFRSYRQLYEPSYLHKWNSSVDSIEDSPSRRALSEAVIKTVDCRCDNLISSEFNSQFAILVGPHLSPEMPIGSHERVLIDQCPNNASA